MKYSYLRKRIVLVLVGILVMFLLCSCMSPKRNIGNHAELSEQFITSLVKDDYDGAYALVKNTVNAVEFSNYWETIQPVVSGAKSFEIEQIGWNVTTRNGYTTRTTAHQVYFDNGKTALFRVVTHGNIAGIAGVHFSDITGFVSATDSFVPTVRVILSVVSILVFAFVIWMFVDCLRRKVKHKVLWSILILGSIAFTLTLGQTAGVRFMIGLIFQSSEIAADPSIMAVSIKLVVPLGAILYLCLRKKLTVIPKVSVEPEKMQDTCATEADEAPADNACQEPEDTNANLSNGANQNPFS